MDYSNHNTLPGMLSFEKLTMARNVAAHMPGLALLLGDAEAELPPQVANFMLNLCNQALDLVELIEHADRLLAIELTRHTIALLGEIERRMRPPAPVIDLAARRAARAAELTIPPIPADAVRVF